MTLRSIAVSLALAFVLTFVAGAAAAADLTVTQTGGGAATAGSTRSFVITASSVTLGLPSGITVTVTTTLVGATPVSASGAGWSCSTAGLVVTCTRSNGLAAGASYPAITVTAVIGSGPSYSSCAVVAHAVNAAVQPDQVAGNNTGCATGSVGPQAMGRLCVVKFNDLNGNGSKQNGEPFLPGWTFTLTGSAGAVSGATGGQGSICKNVPTGSYTVTETMQSGWVSTTPGGATPSLPAVVTQGQTTTLTFGNRQPPAPPALTVEKFNESANCNHNGYANPCKFRIRIRNAGTGPYNGPVTFSDTVTFLAVNNMPNTTTPAAPLPAGWTCSASGPPVTCTGPVNLAPNQSTDLVLFLTVTQPTAPIKNCIHLTAPITTQPFCLTM